MTSPTGAHLSNYEIRKEGWKALTERLGISGARVAAIEPRQG